MTDEDSDMLLVLASAVEKQGRELSDLRREVYRFLVNRAWKIAMKCRHYLTVQCLDMPCDSAWMVLYKYGTDINFLNATSLTRYDASIAVLCQKCIYHVLLRAHVQACIPPASEALCSLLLHPACTIEGPPAQASLSSPSLGDVAELLRRLDGAGQLVHAVRCTAKHPVAVVAEG
jgi:hypothetical protein